MEKLFRMMKYVFTVEQVIVTEFFLHTDCGSSVRVTTSTSPLRTSTIVVREDIIKIGSSDRILVAIPES